MQFLALVLGRTEGDIGLAGYLDLDFAEELVSWKSYYGYVFFFIGEVIIY
jgi:hypothetical protein